MRVRFTPAGREDLALVLASLRRGNPMSANRLNQRVKAAIRQLGQFPESGRLIPEFPHISDREVIVPPYRIFYRIQGSTVWITAVWHGAQLPHEPRT